MRVLYRTVIKPSFNLLDKSVPCGSFPTNERAFVNCGVIWGEQANNETAWNEKM